MSRETRTCNCGHAFPEYLGRYGCPNCNGDAMATQKRPYATKTKRRTYTVTDEVHAQLRELGNGNASAGIREAVRVAKENKHDRR